MRATLVVLLFCFHAAISETWKDSGFYEGDVILTDHQERLLLNMTEQEDRQIYNSSDERNAIKSNANRWPNNKIPYVYGTTFSSAEKAVIDKAIADYKAKTCIEIVPRTNERDYVEFIKNGGCYSYWGRTGGKQPVSLDRGCVHKYIVIHELMHAAGFLHEQSRPDRDQYVRINWDNIQSRGKSQFRKKTADQVRVIGKYDLKSIMHYEEYDFSIQWGRKKVMEAIDGTSPLSNHQGFTELDAEKINTLYECGAATTTTTTTTTQKPSCVNNYSGPDWHCTYWKNQGYCTQTYVWWMEKYCKLACGC